MISFHLPYVNLPSELVSLLKTSLVVSDSPAPVFDIIRPNQALYNILESAFQEFNDGRGLEKTMVALTWPNFRERMASIYIYKAMYGRFPPRTDMALVDDIHKFEARFTDQSVHGYSRLFLLGFYFKLANISQKESTGLTGTLQMSTELDPILKLSAGRSEKIDWLVLIVMHLAEALGANVLMHQLSNGKSFEYLYDLLDVESKVKMNDNLLAYSASIQEPDIFLFDKV